jgi:hypothetical protein
MAAYWVVLLERGASNSRFTRYSAVRAAWAATAKSIEIVCSDTGAVALHQFFQRGILLHRYRARRAETDARLWFSRCT